MAEIKKSPNKKYRTHYRKKTCLFCEKGIEHIDYKDVELLSKFISHNCKILPRRTTGTCSKHQRRVALAIKRARIVALLPFVSE